MSEPLIEKNPIILAIMQKQKLLPYSLMSLKLDENAKAQAYNQALIECAEIVQKAPTIEAVPVVHGEWIGERLPASNGGTYGIRRCSRCKAYCLETAYDWYYCPNCGARMDGERRET